MKKILSFFLFSLLVTTSFAQLTVRNNAFLYANDQVLFVEDDVNLKESASSLYLRNDAQLVQGTGVTGNSGLGKLSIFQSGTVHNYAYNFWASPVGNVDTDFAGNSDFRPNTNFYEWIGNVDPLLNEITSIPVSFTGSLDGTSTPLTISSYWLYSYNPGTQYSDWDHIGESGNLASGYGFTMKGITGSTGQLYDFRGKPNTGTINVAVLNGQSTLAGNPYPSALDTAAFIHDPNNNALFDGTLLFWEHDLSVSSHQTADYIGGYGMYTISADGLMQSWNAPIFSSPDANGFPSGIGSASTSGKRIYRYIAVGQGFMVEATADGNLQFKNEHRAYYKQTDPNSEFYKTASQTQKFTNEEQDIYNYNDHGQILPNPYKRFRLNVNFNNAFTRPLLHNFHPTATNGFDFGLESANNETAPTDAYFILQDVPYVTQAHNFDIDLKIPLVLKIEQNMPVAVKVYDIQNLDNQPIYLHDKETDVYYDLTVLNFETNLEAGIYDNRFEIVFNNTNTLTTEAFEDSNFNIFQNNKRSQLEIYNPNAKQINTVTITDVSGKQILNKTDLNTKPQYEFSTKSLSTGVYIVNVTFKDNTVQTKKIIVNN
ncbi:T9SS type A sorting domain-containing protein [Lacinutrix sp. MedPE-SW]|uniref:T9SS type A sorting domain-containing protein n=1 Tax=Lacinutrix sp. MedPE-SW TaxID=1860087 RepID=UPI000918FA1E|nr:T9SS type A sorting domain-containing protein [Lacinutrix sp. MedPE-SW]OIQ22351.1 MAG: hypothetical protein BM549_07605 [Lacinutrix sp. MedPE-SW]